MRPPIKIQAPHHFIRRWPRIRRRDRDYRSKPPLIEKLVSVRKRPVAYRQELLEDLKAQIQTERPLGYSIAHHGDLVDIVVGMEFHLATPVTYRKDERGGQ